jgi:hypothetical protein
VLSPGKTINHAHFDPSAMKHRRVFYYAYGNHPIPLVNSSFYEQALIPVAHHIGIPSLITGSL